MYESIPDERDDSTEFNTTQWADPDVAEVLEASFGPYSLIEPMHELVKGQTTPDELTLRDWFAPLQIADELCLTFTHRDGRMRHVSSDKHTDSGFVAFETTDSGSPVVESVEVGQIEHGLNSQEVHVQPCLIEETAWAEFFD